MRRILVVLGSLFLSSIAIADSPAASDPKAKQLVAQMVSKVGSYDQLKQMHDFECTYTYRKPDGKEDVSTERYVFDGEVSWAQYTKREVHASPQVQPRFSENRVSAPRRCKGLLRRCDT